MSASLKHAPSLGDGQRYSHLQWAQVVPLVESVWAGTTKEG